MKTCKNCGAQNEFMVLRCTSCGNDTFTTSAETGYVNAGGGNKNVIIGILAGVAITAVAALCLFVFSNKEDDSPKKNNRYNYSYSEYEEEETEESDEKEESEDEEAEEENETASDYEEVTEEPEYEAETTEVLCGITEEEESEEEPVTVTFKDEPTTTQNVTEKQTLSEGVMEINDSLQYNLNLFMSNFSEARMDSFTQRPSDDELIKFGHNYNLVNKIGRYETGDWVVAGGNYNKRISENYIYEVLEEHFTCDISRTEGKDSARYSDGYFYTNFTGGMVQNDVSMVNHLEYKGNNVYYVRFNMYFTGGDNSAYYRLNDEQMSADGNLSGSGEAYIIASDINNYNTYYLDSYNVSR